MNQKVNKPTKVLLCAVLTVMSAAFMALPLYADEASGTSADLSPFWTALGIAFVVAFVVVLIMKSGMKNIKGSGAAAEYIDRASVSITLQSDRFLYSTVTKVKKPEPENNKD